MFAPLCKTCKARDRQHDGDSRPLYVVAWLRIAVLFVQRVSHTWIKIESNRVLRSGNVTAHKQAAVSELPCSHKISFSSSFICLA